MAKFEIGLEMGLLSLEELRRFLTRQLRSADVPYIYTDVYLSIDKGEEEVINAIFYQLQGNYVPDRSTDSVVRRSLIGAIRSKWDLGQITTAQCVGFLEKLNDYFTADLSCAAIGEYYRLNQSGAYSDRDFSAMLGSILMQGIM